jgi:ChrR Cupin-like domain
MPDHRPITPRTIKREVIELAGTSVRILEERNEPPATWMIVEHAPHTVIPRHCHSEAIEWSLVLSGSLIDAGGHAITAGNGFSAERGQAHGPFTTDAGCTLLVTYLGVLDFLEG